MTQAHSLRGGVRPAAAKAATPRKSAQGSKTAKASSDGLQLALTASPDRATRGQAVKLTLTVHAAHASGALEYALAYGDGDSAPPEPVPQYCFALPGPAASRTWHFSHIYRAAGSYRVTAHVGVNCGGGHAQVTLVVDVS